MGGEENGRVRALGESEKVIVKIIVSFTIEEKEKVVIIYKKGILINKEWNGVNEGGRSRKI